MVFYDSDKLHAIHHKGDPRRGTLIQFSAAILAPGKEPLWAKAFFARWKGDAILITPRGKDYFPKALMGPLLEAMPALHSPVVLMGSSMGGYGALKYSSALGADAVLTFAPQFAVSPHEAPFDVGRHGFYLPDLHGDMAIRAGDVSGEVALFYDPEVKWDKLHAQAIVGAIPDAKVVTARYGGHELIELFKTEQGLAGAVAHTLEGPTCALQQHGTDYKKRFVNYYINLAIVLIRKKQLARAHNVLEAAFARFKRARVLLFCHAQLLRAEGKPQDAFDVFREGLEIHSYEPDFQQLILGGELASAAGESEQALDLFRRAAQNSFIRPQAHICYLKEFIKQERWEEGLLAAATPLRKFPNSDAIRRCVHILEARGVQPAPAPDTPQIKRPQPERPEPERDGFKARVLRKIRNGMAKLRQQ